MSGLVGIVHFDGRPVDPELLEALTVSLRFRAPDGERTWTDGAAGLGVASFATGHPGGEGRLATLDGVHVAADARLDDRDALIAELESARGRGLGDAGDTELILLAYLTWGDRAVDHLLGDFCFAAWDGRRRRLLCARDHLGVKPFYFAEWPGGVAFSNTLRVLRRHPAVTGDLNRQALADFLLFETHPDLETTAFAGLHRLPPAHLRIWTPERRESRRYWSLPTVVPRDGDVPEEERAERFRDLLTTAVEDRVPTGTVAVMMSGGLDSTAVAALAHGVLARRDPPGTLHCHTLVYDRLIPDRERRYAAVVGDALGVPVHYLPMDGYRMFERWGELPVAPEPADRVIDAVYHDLERTVSREARVMLTGLGADPLLYPSRGHFLALLRELRLGPAVGYLVASLVRSGRLPPLGLHTRWARWRRRRSWRAGYPSWLDPGLEAELDLLERWRWYHLDHRPRPPHPTRPEAHRNVWSSEWAGVFERWNPGARGTLVEQRHPFFDVRLVEHLLATPPVPWCLEKRLLREAMRGVLPEPVRRRAKTPLAGAPRHPTDAPPSRRWRELARQSPEIEHFVRPRAVRRAVARAETTPHALPRDLLRPFSLAYWLADRDRL